jgi:hypothetical protein
MLHTLRVYFFGLICHVSKSNSREVKDFAYLVRADGHYPIVGYGPLSSPNHTHSFVRIDDNVPNATGIALSLGPDQAQTDLLFRTYVPSLQAILGGTLAPENPDNAIKFLYPRNAIDAAGRGFLSVASLYPLIGKYTRSGSGSNTRHNGPVARLTELTIFTEEETFDVNVTARNTTTTIYNDVSTDGCLFIGNVEPEAIEVIDPQLQKRLDDQDDDDLHVQKYDVLLMGAGKVHLEQNMAHSETVAPPPCDWIEILIRHLIEGRVTVGVSVECGNTDYP